MPQQRWGQPDASGPPQRRPGWGPGAWIALVIVLLLIVGGTAAGAAVWIQNDGDAPAREASGPGNRAAANDPGPAPESPAPEPADPQDFAGTYEDVESGVLRILATTCEGDGIGTGFLLDSRTVATAAHVVDGADAVAVDAPSGPEPAHVVGIDPVSDLALLRLDAPVPGHVFTFAEGNPSPGTTVAAIGFPLDEPKTLTIGVVSGLDRTITVEGESRSGMLQTDTAINPGNSGGPLVNANGEVVGVVDALMSHSQGIGYAVQVSVAQPSLAEPTSMDAPIPSGCAETQAPDELVVAPRLIPPSDPVASAVQQTLATYYNAINAGDYDTVVQQFSPAYRGGFSADEMSRTLATSFDFSVVVHDVTGSTASADAWVTFVSVQAPRFGPDGEVCTAWSLDYSFVDSGGALLIDGVGPHDGEGHAPC